MSVIFDLPADLEQRLRVRFTSLDAEAKEAMLIELYRRDEISRRELSLALGVSRLETDAVLKAHNVVEDLPTLQELEQDINDAIKLVGH